MTQAESQARDLLNAIDDDPVTFTFGSSTFTGIRGAVVFPDNLQDGGFLKDYDLTLVTTLQRLDESGNLVDRFTTEPVNGDQITISSILYDIHEVTKDHLDVALQFKLANAIK